ncbi:MAG TPA: RNA chaperone Hfq [Desulfobacteria bacterium]|nr:RNA chaperone Hfq [Desulfobacteria bacterium]
MTVTKNQINLQDSFLNQVRKENIPVTVYLVNGFQLKGMVRGFDNFTVIIEFEGKQQMVYKHAISTVMPLKAINFNAEAKPQAPQA